MTRGLKAVWAESLQTVRAHGGEVTHFMELLSVKGKDKLLTVKEHTRSMPPDVMMKYGHDGGGKAESYDFDNIVARMQEDVLRSMTKHCLYDGKILTTTNIMHAWSSEAVEWASRKSVWYYNILVGTDVFDDLDESKKLPAYFFKNARTAPRTFADAFPNISIYKAKKMEENNKAVEASSGEAPTPAWSPPRSPRSPGASREENFLAKHLSVSELGVVVSRLGDSAVRQYKQQEQKRARRSSLFHSKKLQRFTDNDIDQVIHQQRRRQIKALLTEAYD